MLKFKIVTPEGITYSDDSVDSVTIPTTTGQITVLQNHIPLVSILAPGELVVHKGTEDIPMAVSGGVVEVRPESEVYIMADSAVRAEHIDVTAAETAKAKAEELLKQQENAADVDFARLQAMIEREVVKIKVGNKYRK